MLFAALVSLLGGCLLEVAVELGLKKAAQKIRGKWVAKKESQLTARPEQEEFEAIQRALIRAREDVLDQYHANEERKVVEQLLDVWLKNASDPLPKELGIKVTQVYLLENPNPIQIPAFWGELQSVIITDHANEPVQLKLLHRFFLAYRERLLQEPGYAFLREYSQLLETRKQSRSQENVLERLPGTLRS